MGALHSELFPTGSTSGKPPAPPSQNAPAHDQAQNRALFRLQRCVGLFPASTLFYRLCAICYSQPKPRDPASLAQYYTASSLDGFIATEEDSLDWLFPLGDVNETSYPAFIAEVGALAMGSATYEWMLRHGQTVTAETGSAWPYTQPTWVFSSRALPAIPGANLCFARGDVRPVHSAMRADDGRLIWVEI